MPGTMKHPVEGLRPFERRVAIWLPPSADTTLS